LQARPKKARQFGLEAFNAAIGGVTGTTAVHICFGYAAVFILLATNLPSNSDRL